MANRILVKQDDTKPPVRAQLLDANGDPIDLSNVPADGVTFQVETKGETTVVSGACEIVNATEGQVRYEWSSSDTADAGEFRGEFDVSYSDGSTQTVPNDGYIPVKITRQIDG